MKELQKDAVNSYGVSEAFIGGFLSQMVLMDKNQITEENIFKCINTAEEVSAEVRTTNPFGQWFEKLISKITLCWWYLNEMPF